MKIIRNNVLGFILGAIVFGSIGIAVASQILATQVGYTNEKSEANVINVDGALTELYSLAETCINNASSGSSVTYYGKDAVPIYLDPTGTVTNCSSSNYSSTESTGCFRFYVYAEDSEYKYAILDHNTTATGLTFYTAQLQVKQDTSSWDPNYQARNISAMEVYKITESTNKQTNWQINGGSSSYFNSTNSNGSSGNGQDYGWLFDRTFNCTDYGCTTSDSSTYGYWTSDTRNSSEAWVVHFAGNFSECDLSAPDYGVRPVIQILK